MSVVLLMFYRFYSVHTQCFHLEGEDRLLKLSEFFLFCNLKCVTEQPELVSESGRGADREESMAEAKLFRHAGQK